MLVEVHMLSQSHPIVRRDVENTYTKDGMFCLYRRGEAGPTVEKYPLVGIFRVVEPYAQ